jgi:hypothetical protein
MLHTLYDPAGRAEVHPNIAWILPLVAGPRLVPLRAKQVTPPRPFQPLLYRDLLVRTRPRRVGLLDAGSAAAGVPPEV